MATIGIVGLGRIGRSLVRVLRERPDIRLAAIRDPAEPEQLAYLLRYDTILGPFPEPIALEDGNLRIGERRTRLIAGKTAGPVPWGELGADVVIDASGETIGRGELEEHLARGARHVIVCGPTAEPPDLLAVAGLTDATIAPAHRVLSLGTPTVQCAAPALRILQDAFGLRHVAMTAIHSYTGAHHLADAPADDLRRGRAAAANIIPQASRSAEMLTQLIPELAGRLSAFALNVPAYNASVVDVVAWHDREAGAEEIRAAFRAAARDPRWHALRVTEDPIVSSDAARLAESSLFDSLATMALPGRVSKTLFWFDSGLAFARRALELADQLEVRA